MQTVASETVRPSAGVDERPAPRRSRWRIALIAIGVAYGTLTVVVLVANAAGLGDAVAELGDMRLWWIAVALAAVVARHSLYAVQIGLLGRRSHGLDRRQVAAIDLIVVVSIGHLSFAPGWPLVSLAMLVIVVAAVFVLMLARPTVGVAVAMRVARLPLLRRRMANADRATALAAWCADARPLVGTVRLRSGLAGVSALSVLADGAVLWAAASAAGVHLSFDVVLLATTVGVLAGLLPFLPGGIGVVDAAIPALLHRYGIPLDQAVAITIVYRALTLVLPMLAGVGSLLWLRRDDRRLPVR